MLRKINTKKGDPTDVFLFLVILFFLAISMVIALFMNQKIQDTISTTVLNQSEAYDSINESFTSINQYVVQRGFTLFFGILIIGIMISSFLIRVHPIFIFIYIITLGSSIFVALYLGNAYALVVSNNQLQTIAENFTMMTWVMQNVNKILLGVGALSMFIIFAKIGGGGQFGSPNDL